MKWRPMEKMLKSKFLTLALIVAISYLGVSIIIEPKQKTLEPEKKPTVEERINKLTNIEELEKKAKKEGDYFLEKYYRLENQFFILLSLHYGGKTPESEVREKANYLIRKKNFLEAKIN